MRNPSGRPAARKRADGKSRVAAVHDGVAAAIFARDLPPGTKLSEDALGNVFGVSRSVVRVALNRLHADALVELVPNRGAFVARPSVSAARHVFEARICIEQQIAANLAGCITRQQLAELSAHVAQEADAVRRGDRPAAIRLSGEFHQLAARMAGNDVLAEILGKLVARSSLVLALHARDHAAECGHEDHLRIIAALRQGDAAGSAGAMTRHLSDIMTRTLVLEAPPATRSVAKILSAYR